VVGWREWVCLPALGIESIKAKVDTGARTSSLHVEDIKLLGNNRISFNVVTDNKARSGGKIIIATRVKKGKVKSSLGMRTERWYVQTKIRMGNMQRDIIINLVGREEMNFRVLLGRTAIDEVFLVDADKSFVLGKNKKGKKAKR